MKDERAFLFVIVALIVAGYLAAQSGAEKDRSIPDRDIGLSKSTVFEVSNPDVIAWDESEPGDRPVVPRPHDESPPVIPHDVKIYLPLTWEENMCIDCHLADEAGKSDGKPIPESHLLDLRNAPDEAGTTVAGARQACVTCHVARSEAEPLVGNSFRP